MIKEELLSRMEKAIVEGDKNMAENLARDAIEKHMDLNEIIEKGYVPGIQETGRLWEEGEYFLPELIISAESMKAAMNILQPELEKENIKVKSKGKIVIGTIEGDIHDIGKNLVVSMLSSYGFEVTDLGNDVKLEKFIIKADEVNADLICLSSLLTTTMLGQKKFIEMLKEKNLKARFKVMVGGAPVNQKWANDIGADGYAENAMSAIQAAENLIKK